MARNYIIYTKSVLDYIALVENSKKFDYNLNALRFVAKHHTTPENAQVARAIVDGNLQAIDRCIRNGTFTLARYEEILRDDELKTVYALMIDAMQRENDEAFDELFTKIKDKLDTFCGWLDTYNQYLEYSMDMDLLHRSRPFYQMEDFKNES